MKNIVCFNELSIQPLCQTEAEVEQRIGDFVSLLKEVRNHTGVTKVRHADYMTSIPLTEDITMQDYCNAHTKSPQAIILMNTFIHPQVDMDDDVTLQSYLDTVTEVVVDENQTQWADGFNAAYCQNTFCIGFDSEDVWHNDFFDLKITSNGRTKEVKWACISSLLFYSAEAQHVSRKQVFDRWLQSVQPVSLLASDKDVSQKGIALRDDHGKDKLEAHARLLCNHPNVEGILTSLPFKPHARSYIVNVTDDGLVDVVLWWEDQGFSMRVKTTGRNAAETREIANLLKEKYGKK